MISKHWERESLPNPLCPPMPATPTKLEIALKLFLTMLFSGFDRQKAQSLNHYMLPAPQRVPFLVLATL